MKYAGYNSPEGESVTANEFEMRAERDHKDKINSIS